MPPVVAVVIPCYRVTRHILGVLGRMGAEVDRIYVVDDACPDRSGDFVESHCTDPRVRVLRHEDNRGVGGAVKTGYVEALREGADIVVKLDGDGQMDPRLIPYFVEPIRRGLADYTKGNRFYDLEKIRRMPTSRLLGNALLSFAAKLSTGYWNLFDVNNGYTAIHTSVLRRLPLDKVNERYFFETDMLFRLNTIRAVVIDIPMDAVYADEKSHLVIRKAAIEFGLRHLRNMFKRIAYNYFLRDMTAASFELVLGIALLGFGVVFGAWHWWLSISTGQPASAGTVMLGALPSIVGLQLLLGFLAYDISNIPRRPIHLDLPTPLEEDVP